MTVIGVTGQMGTGKTHLVKTLTSYLEQKRIPVRVVSVDDVRRRLVTTSPALRAKLAAHFNLPEVFGLRELAAAVFGAETGPEDFWRIAGPDIVTTVTSQLQGPGVGLLEWSRLIEDGFAPLVDRVVVVTCDTPEQQRRLSGGDLPAEQVSKRLGLQMSAEAIAAALAKIGKPFCVFDTTRSPPPSDYHRLCDEVLHEAA